MTLVGLTDMGVQAASGPSAGPLPSRPAPQRGLSPDANCPGDISRLAKSWAFGPSAACKAVRRTRQTRR